MLVVIPVIPKSHPVVRLALSPFPMELERWTLNIRGINLVGGIFFTNAASPEVVDRVPIVVRDVESRVGRNVPLLVEIMDALLAQVDLDFAGTGSPGGV